MSNTKNETKTPGKVGRPAAELTYPRGAFTINELFEANKDKVKWPLTVRQHVEKQVKAGFLSKLPDTEKTGKVGKPAFRYMRSAVLAGIEARKAKSETEGSTPSETPVQAEAPVEVTNPAPVVEVSLTMVDEPTIEVPITEGATVSETVSA